MLKIFGSAACLFGALMMASPAQAQLGGLGMKMPGSGNSNNAAVDKDAVDKFVKKSYEATKYIYTAAIILNEAAKDHPNIASQKEILKAINDAPSIKDIDGQSVQLQSNVDELAKNENASANIQTYLKGASAKEKGMIASAVFNFALYVPQLVQLPGDGSKMIQSIASNPMLLAKAKEIKIAVKLLGLQAKSAGVFMKLMPTLIKAAKIEQPKVGDAAVGKSISAD